MTPPPSQETQTHQDDHLSYRGLAPILRRSLSGLPLDTIFRQVFARAGVETDNPELWLQMALLMLAMNQRDKGLQCQTEALTLNRFYTIPARQQPVACRVLLLMAPGDLSANMPIECLLDGMDIELLQWFCSEVRLIPNPVPEHDVLMVAMSESTANRPLLQALTPLLKNWPKAVINAPSHVLHVGRVTASALLQHQAGLLSPVTDYHIRADLENRHDALQLPCIIRPVDSHAGNDLERILDPEDLAAYLAKVPARAFYTAPYIDYRSADGRFRKYRIALLRGQPYACHMAISDHWIVHYVNAGMYEDAQKRQEESAFMQSFPENFAHRHASAWDAIYQQTGLDYVCVDCAETREGQLLIFEIDHAMVVHAMDDPERFAYKTMPMQSLQMAFRSLLLSVA